MRQSFAWWSFTAGREVDPARLLREAAEVGAQGVEMLPEPLWPVARDAGLSLVTLTGHTLERGFNDPSLHAALTDEVRRNIDTAAAGGCESVIVFSGDRIGDGADAPAIAACIEGLAPVVAHAEQAGVRLLMELLNSKVDHPGHQCDRTAFGAEVVRTIGSPALMEGDLMRTIRANIDLIGHVHTAGAPGRRDLDDRQEIHWPAIAGLLRHLGYKGWVGHEFIPRGDPVAALQAALVQFDGSLQSRGAA
jgi:hydroxypyruvate isomerase